MKLRAISRAEYWWQPLQIPRRAWRTFARTFRQAQATLQLPWGFPLTINPRESIGRSVVALNVLDLPVTETIWRLLDDGETAADIGANIGYMTSVMAARLRNGGTLHSFEPLPELAARLSAHVRVWRQLSHATIHVHENAVSDSNEPAELFTPHDWDANEGTASLDRAGFSGCPSSVRVRCCRLDDAFAGRSVPQLMKVDVEGCEARVFRGGDQLLTAGRIRDLIFEELRPAPAESLEFLRARGYVVFRIARQFSGPRLAPPQEPLRGQMDPPSFLATRDPERALERFRPRGWKCLARSQSPRPA